MLDFGGPPEFVWLDSKKRSVFLWFNSSGPLGIRMVELSEALRFLFGWTIRVPPVFVWLDS